MTVVLWFISLFVFIGLIALFSGVKNEKIRFWLKLIAAILFIASPVLFSTDDAVVYVIINIIFVFIAAAS